jgi:hypothetical protein
MPRTTLALLASLGLVLSRQAGAAPGNNLEQQAAAFESSVLKIWQEVHAAPRDRYASIASRLSAATDINWAHDLDYVVDRAKETVEAIKQGKAFDVAYAKRAAMLLGLSDGYSAFRKHHFSHGDQARLASLLQSGADPTGATGDRSAALLKTIYTARFWEQYGDRGRSQAALRSAQRQAGRLGLDLRPLLAIPVKFEGSGFAGTYGLTPGAPGAERLALKGDSGRLPGGRLQWWTGTPQAHLDLVYNKLPELIVQRFERDRGEHKPVLRVWHAGFEDGSQTLFLAAGVEEAITRLRRTRPEMRSYLDRLTVEIDATDHLQRLQRAGRTIHFSDTEVVSATKSPLALAEFGRDQVRQAKQELRGLERGLTGEVDPTRLDALARAGKVGQLMGRVLELRGISVPGRKVDFSYRIKSGGWRIEDQVNGGVIPGKAGDRRRIRFLRQDITRQSPGAKHSMDLVVCTNVLAYLHLYGGQDNKMGAGLRQIAGSLRRGGALMIDGWNSEFLIRDKHPSFLRAMERSQRQVWVAPVGKPLPLKSATPRR